MGQLLFAGPGAGGDPTATAVLGDVIDAARGVALRVPGGAPRSGSPRREVADFGTIATKWYVRLEVVRPPRGAGRASPPPSASTGSASSRCARRAEATGRPCCWSPIGPPRRGSGRRSRRSRALDVVAEVGAVIRVESDES